jgi:hypothetical protein
VCCIVKAGHIVDQDHMIPDRTAIDGVKFFQRRASLGQFGTIILAHVGIQPKQRGAVDLCDDAGQYLPTVSVMQSNMALLDLLLESFTGCPILMLMYLYAVALITAGLQSTPQTIAHQGTSFYEDVPAESPEITAHGSVIGQRPPGPLRGIGF